MSASTTAWNSATKSPSELCLKRWTKQREDKNFHPMPYPSLEGGPDTVGYGHKFYRAEDQAAWLAQRNHKPLSELEADQLFDKDWETAKRQARRGVESMHYQWKDFTPNAKLMLTDFAFNGGFGMVTQYKKFVHALHEGDAAAAQRECHRHYYFTNKQGVVEVRELQDRNQQFQKLFFNASAIACPKHTQSHSPSYPQSHSHSLESTSTSTPLGRARHSQGQHSHADPSQSHPPANRDRNHSDSHASSHFLEEKKDGGNNSQSQSRAQSVSSQHAIVPPGRHGLSQPLTSSPAYAHANAATWVDDDGGDGDGDVVGDDNDEFVPDLLDEEFDSMNHRVETVSNLSLLGDHTHGHGSHYHLIDPNDLQFYQHVVSSGADALQSVDSSHAKLFDVANQAELAVKSMGANMVNDAANLFFGTHDAKPTLPQITSHLLATTTSVLSRTLVHNQLNALLFGEIASHFETALLDTGAAVGLALAYGNAEAARKAAFESALNYAIHELDMPFSYSHSKTSIGGTLFQSDVRILSGKVDQHSANIPIVAGVSGGFHFRSANFVRQEGDHVVNRQSHSIGGHISGLGVGSVSVGFGSRRDQSDVVHRQDGAQTVSTWFTRAEDGKFMADVKVANRMSDLADLSLKETLVLCAHNPLMTPLAILSRLPALFSHKETHTLRANTDGMPLSITRGLPLSHLAGPYQSTQLLAPLDASAIGVSIDVASELHRFIAEPLRQSALSQIGRIETVDSTGHTHGEQKNIAGILGSGETDRYVNNGRIIENTARHQTASVNGEIVTDINSRTTTHAYTDITYAYSYTRSGLFGHSRHKWEQWYKAGEKRIANTIKQTIDRQTRLRSREDGSAYRTREIDEKRDDGSELRRTEWVLAIEESAKLTNNHGVNSARDTQVTHHGQFEQSITSSSTSLIPDTEHVKQTDVFDKSAGRFSDRVSSQDQLLTQPERQPEQIDRHTITTREILRNRDPSKPLAVHTLHGDRECGGVRATQASVAVYEEMKLHDEYKIARQSHPNDLPLQSDWQRTAHGTITLNQQLMASTTMITPMTHQWSNRPCHQSDTLSETIHATYAATLEIGSIVVDGVSNTAVYGLGTKDEAMTPMTRAVTASRTYTATAMADANGLSTPSILYSQAALTETAPNSNFLLRQEQHYINKVIESHTATYNLATRQFVDNGAAEPTVNAADAPSTSTSNAGAASALNRELKRISQARLGAALSSGDVDVAILSGRGNASEGDPELVRRRFAMGLSVDCEATGVDYDVQTRTLRESHVIRQANVIKESELQEGTGSRAKYGEETVIDHVPIAITNREVQTQRGLFMNTSTVKSQTAAIVAGQQQEFVDDAAMSTVYESSAALRSAAGTASSILTGLAVRQATTNKPITKLDVADLSIVASRSLCTAHIMDSINMAEQTIQRSAALKIEATALKEGRLRLRTTGLLQGTAVILVANTVRHSVTLMRQNIDEETKLAMAERRRQENQDPNVAPVNAPRVSVPMKLSLGDARTVLVNTAVDSTPLAIQLALAGQRNVFLATTGLNMAIDAVRTGYSYSKGTITKEKAIDTMIVSGVSTLAGVGGSMAFELLLPVLLGIAGLPLAVFVGVGTALVTLGVQWLVIKFLDSQRRKPLEMEYRVICAQLGVLEKCSDSSLHAAWRDAAVQCHPDKPTGSHDKFVELSARHKRAIELRMMLKISREREDGQRRGERTRMPTWIRWWQHLLTNLIQSMTDAPQPRVPSMSDLDQMLVLYNPVSPQFHQWQQREEVYAVEIDE